jgi:hypothetical protein
MAGAEWKGSDHGLFQRGGGPNHHWEERTEQLTKNLVLTCYRRPTPYYGIGGDRAWVYVLDTDRKPIEAHLIEPSNPLLMECMAHEMRAKYGAK